MGRQERGPAPPD
uniref:Uncharacterized protein n=1 Tax=Anguilla anguilla TaxID=7936 RepID=A0A0E9XNC0_ANGAN